jgi:IS1 family transposase
LYRIPGLSEVFLYNNDDYMHFSPVPRDTFVTDRDGRASLELWSTRAIIRRLIHVLSDRAPGFLPRANVHTTGISHAFAWLRSRQGVRWHEVLVPRHVTQVLRVSTARRVEEEFAEALRRSREPRVRTREWVSYATLMYTMERQWHPYDRVRHWRPYDEASPIRMFDFLHHRSPATSDRVWRRIAESEARLVCLNNIRAFDRARFVATMKAKGLGEPLDGVAAAPADGMLTCHG